MSQIFISYGRQDAREFADKLAGYLKENGFEPWLDRRDAIIAGEPFDIRLEQGISESSLLIALISPWSIRQESYCRNEWLYALSISKPILPIRLTNINPPLIIINLHYEDAFDEPDLIFKKIIPIINEVASTGQPRYREWLPSEDIKSWWSHLERFNFEGELKIYGESFIGREWFFEKLVNWVNEGESQIGLIKADTGMGKSAIAAQLTAWMNTRSVHFCTASNVKTCEPVEWIKDLIYQLAAQFDDYRLEIEKRTTEPNWGTKAETLFRSLITDPLSKFENKFRSMDPWVFVIDSLDESLAVAGPALSDLLIWSVNFMPKWIKIIVTCRPDQTIISKFSIVGVKHFSLKASDPENKLDLYKYVEKRLEHIKEKLNLSSIAATVEKIAELSEGNFQYAKVLIDSMQIAEKKDRSLTEQLEQFPVNLIGLYDRIFRKRFSDIKNYKNEILPLINCLIASKEPLQEDFLKKSSRLDESTANDALIALSQFLNRTPSGLRLFHKSLTEWLSNLNQSTEFTASISTGQQLLADCCWYEYLKDHKRLSGYCKKYLPSHLAETERWDALLEIVKNPDLNLIRSWTDEGKGDIGINCLRGLIGYLGNKKNEKTIMAGLATQIARIYSLMGNYVLAKEYLNLASKKTSICQGRRIKAVALHELGSLALYCRDYKEAGRNYRHALLLCKWGSKLYYDEAASNLVGLSTIAYEDHQLKPAIRFADKSISYSGKAGDFNHRIAAERMLGAIHKRIGNYDEASLHFDKALKLCELINDVRERYRILLLQGWLELDKAALGGVITKNAIPFFLKGLEYARNSLDYYYTQEAMLSIAWTYLKENNESEAIKYLKSATERKDLLVHPELKAGRDSWQVNLYYLRKDYENALESGLKLLQILTKLRMISRQIQLLIVLGSVYWHLGNTHESGIYWEKALATSESVSGKRIKLTQTGIEMCKKDPIWIPQ